MVILRMDSTKAGPVGRTSANLLDVDALKSASAFYTKPRNDPALFWRGLVRVLLFPGFPRWWVPRIGARRFRTFVLLETAYIASLALHVPPQRWLAFMGTSDDGETATGGALRAGARGASPW